MDVVATRLHVRRYSNQTISKESIRALLQAAMAAHSEGDERPWHFVVVEDLAMRKRIVETHPTAHIVVQAPVVILVCGDPTLQKHPGFWVQDCAAATENILIKAQAMGLGAMWFGVYPIEGRVQHIRNILDLPPTVHSFFVDDRWSSGRPQRIEMPIRRISGTFRAMADALRTWANRHAHVHRGSSWSWQFRIRMQQHVDDCCIGWLHAVLRRHDVRVFLDKALLLVGVVARQIARHADEKVILGEIFFSPWCRRSSNRTRSSLKRPCGGHCRVSR